MAGGEKKRAQSEARRRGAHRAAAGHSAAVGAALRLRVGELADLPDLLRIEAQFPGDRLSPRQLRHHLQSSRALLRVATGEQGVVLGYALVLLHAQRRRARLYSIAVDTCARGLGLGGQLLADAERAARAAGALGMALEVRADNAAALTLYQTRGYAVFARREAYYDDGAAALCLRRDWAASDGAIST